MAEVEEKRPRLQAILQHVIERFLLDDLVERVVVPIAPQPLGSIKQTERVTFVAGGETRMQSVIRGVAEAGEADLIAIHDAVRPLFGPQLLDLVATAAEEVGAALPVLPVTDTIHVMNEDATIAKTLVELHGGTIHARSQGQGQGSEFVVELPRYANTRAITRNNNSGAFVLATVRPHRVLVVDDNEDAAFLFAEALRKLGHKVDVANDGPSALAVARANPPEIAFLDIGLPVMDGYELGRRLRELGAKPPHLVAVTGYGHTSDRERSREAGFDMHLVKPIELAQVQDAIAKLG